MWRDAKYLLAFVPTAFAYLSVLWAGSWSFAGVGFAFVVIPFLELFSKNSEENFTEEQEVSKLANRFFDWLLYLNIPLLYGLLWLYFGRIADGGLATYEIVGMTLSTGVIAGSLGINVAHELGHRQTKHEQFMSKVLLLSCLYMHFFIEHNRGHHLKVATLEDPATSRYGEVVYAFWVRSVVNSFLDAWRLENNRLKQQGKGWLSIHNDMIWYQVIQLTYLVAAGLIFGWAIIPFVVAVAIIGFLQLETVNYIEHYGLLRNKMENGRYERVQPQHSWNSNHDLARIFLYELTRHSDPHFI